MADPKKGVLYVHIHGGRNLAAKDIGGTSDPYCVVGLLDSKGHEMDTKQPQYRTPVIKKTLNPTWNEEKYEFKPIVESQTRIVQILVWDEDMFTDDFLGELRINPNDLADGYTIDSWYTLQSRVGKKDKISGELHVTLLYNRLKPVEISPYTDTTAPSSDVAAPASGAKSPSSTKPATSTSVSSPSASTIAPSITTTSGVAQSSSSAVSSSNSVATSSSGVATSSGNVSSPIVAPNVTSAVASPTAKKEPIVAKGVNLADSNIANLGSDLEKQVRLEAAKTEVAWTNAGQKPGLEIWRIEKFNVKTWPIDQHGKFFMGDSYIVLHTYKKNPKTDALAWDVHFWLGEQTSQDEAGTAAYKTVELDDLLGGAPVEHREVQGYESELFLSYFKSGMVLMEGGIESGFKHVGPKEYKPKLFHLKGKKNVRMVEVELKRSSLNSGDVFILDAGLHLYQWQGKFSGPNEKLKGAQVSRALDDERDGVPTVTVLDEGSDTGSDSREFWSLLGGRGEIAAAETAGSDIDFEKSNAVVRRLFRLSDQTGQLLFTEVATGRVTRKMLSSADVFIFDTGTHVFVWIGRGASENEKRKAMQHAIAYLTQYQRPAYIPISRILEGGENTLFEQSFDTV